MPQALAHLKTRHKLMLAVVLLMAAAGAVVVL